MPGIEDVSVIFGSIGLDKLRADFDSLHGKFEQLGSKALGLTNDFEKMSGVFNSGGVSAAGFAESIMKITIGLTALAAAAAGAALAGIGEFAKKVVEATDSQRKWELSVYGMASSWEAVGKLHQFAVEYAIKYGLEVDKIQASLKTFMLMPGVGALIKEGDVKQAERLMNIVQQFMVLKPEMGMEEIVGAIKMASAGGRPERLKRLTGISAEQLAAETGMGKAEMKDPEKLIEALEKFTGSRVGLDMMTASSQLLGRQLTAMREAWKNWLDEIGKSGIYANVVEKLNLIRTAFANMLETGQLGQLTKKISMFLEDFVDGIFRIFTKGIDWSKVTDWDSFVDAVGKVAENAKDALLSVWEKIKEPLANALREAVKGAGAALMWTIDQVFIPIGVDIAQAIVKGIKSGAATVWEAIKDIFKKKPVEEEPGKAPMTPKEKARMMYEGPPEATHVPWMPETMPEEEKKKLADTEKAKKGIKKEEEDTDRQIQLIGRAMREMMNSNAKAAQDVAKKLKEHAAGVVQTAEDQFKEVEKWAHMQKQYVTAKTSADKIIEDMQKEREHQQMREKWEAGKITDDEWKKYVAKDMEHEEKRRKLKEFEDAHEKKLLDVVSRPDATSATKEKAYEKLFGIAIEKGETYKAGDYMVKALENLEKAQREAKNTDKNIEKNTEKTANNTEKMYIWWTGHTPPEGAETTPTVSGGSGGTPQSPASPPVKDEILIDVQTGDRSAI